MITTHLTVDQLAQLEALLADTTSGGGVYRPPVGRDVWVLRDLEHANLCRFTVDCGYEITEAGRVAVVDHAMEAAESELAEGRSESTGRHHLVPADDRPTEVIPAVEQTVIGSSSGTLTGLPVVDGPCDPDKDATVRLIAAIRATPSPAELAEMAAINTAGWDALEADLGDDDRSWLRRKLRPHRVLILSIVATVVVTWFVAWLVMG